MPWENENYFSDQLINLLEVNTQGDGINYYT